MLGDDWRARAACGKASLDWFFAADGSGEQATALRVCAACPVLAECREDADRFERKATTHGVRAGRTARERVRERDELRRRGRAPRPERVVLPAWDSLSISSAGRPGRRLAS